MVIFGKKVFMGIHRRVFVIMIVVLPLFEALRQIFMSGLRKHYYSHGVALELTLRYMIISQCGILTFSQSSIYLGYSWIVYFISIMVDRFRSASDSDPHKIRTLDLEVVFYAFYSLMTMIFSLANSYIFIKSEISTFNNSNMGANNSARIHEVVDRLLPRHVRENIGKSNSSGEIASNVTLLYADIVGFTGFSASRSPKEVVEMLSQLFTAFDKECIKLNLYKVYTIGDCYVVMSFTDKNARLAPEKECVNVCELGFKMIEIIAQVRKTLNFENLHMRIGIHTGKIIGGLIGTGIIRYDLYGHDVLIANKMESSGANDTLHISKATKELLEKVAHKNYFFTPDKDIKINALNKSVFSYFLKRNLGEHSSVNN